MLRPKYESLRFNDPGCKTKGRGTHPLHLPFIIGSNRKHFAEIDYFCKDVTDLKLSKVSNLEGLERFLFFFFIFQTRNAPKKE